MLNFKQELTGAFGQPIAENPTQVMMEAAYAHHGLDWRYLTIEVAPEYLGDAVRGARAMGFRGFNCTIPHKIPVIQHLDRLTEAARLIGAVNCVTNRDGEFVGENTDGKGFLSSLCEVENPAGKEIVIFGAGGAARAIAVELALAHARRITIVNRAESRGYHLATLLREKSPVEAHFIPWDGDYQIPESTNIVVNATSIGLFPAHETCLPVLLESLHPHMIVADVIPNPPRTHLLATAAARGCRTLDGLGMLVRQGALGIECWAGISPDFSIMRQALEKIFQP